MDRCNKCAAMHKDGDSFYCEFLEVILDLQKGTEAPCVNQK